MDKQKGNEMPNWITNIIITEDADGEIFDFIFNDDGHIDFNIVTPMPDYIKNTSCGTTVEYEDSSILNLQEAAKTRRPLTEDELEKGAGEGWYNWSRRNWGCKWNAKNTVKLHYDIVSFQTAWSPPIEYLKSLSKLYPIETLYCAFKNEGADGGLVNYTVKNGVVDEL